MDILDCTLRDGGYYTNWDFDQEVVSKYVNAMEQLPINCIELGYRQLPVNGYVGRFGYCPLYVIKEIKGKTSKRIAIMLNEKSTDIKDLETLVAPLNGIIDIIRLAVDPQNFSRAIKLAKEIKQYGFELSLNLMYMSKWSRYDGLYDNITKSDDYFDILTMVDSYGSIMPTEVVDTIKELKNRIKSKLGFHGHNNMQMGLANTIAAINSGIDSVDCTILGMGRGAGNLNTELLLTYLNRHGVPVDYNTLGDVISAFMPLHKRHQWGTQLPYMISGAFSLPQKEVMELVTNRTYSFDSIVRGLQDRINNSDDIETYPIFNPTKYDSVIIIGGGVSPKDHYDAIANFIKNHQSIALVFATARYATLFENINVPKFYCLVGREAKRLSSISDRNFNDICILPPHPRKLGSEVPEFAKDKTFELPRILFTQAFHDSCTTLALQTSLLVAIDNIYIVGYDGYASILSEKESALTTENRTLFNDYTNYTNKKLISLTQTLYSELTEESIYQYV